ncbi:hypothetical protein [Jiulongibacter sediminis]|uniref:Uncharacterized protein n=1 Tax=Jiulongibacter sediminis TaxID=1605367 RepID=A0A0P7BZX7_9BACT|nr:hypothetical protein [Jiulongibacter sediminis]KPM47821.1 hypothetical protein AFM12_11250 [Jiulongibacter sediminis]TBX24005.1 hypothetical protein TK44_11255 [Jiulongibacter sediminis]
MLFNPKTQTTIARWASKNVILAQTLLSAAEIGRLSIAFYLGTVLMAKVGVNELLLITIFTFSLAYAVLKCKTKRLHFRSYLSRAMVIMSLTWFTSFSIGGFLSPQNNSEPSVYAGDVITIQESGLLKKAQEQNTLELTRKKRNGRYKPKTGMGKRRILYGFLFVLSLALTAAGAMLTCTLTCTGLWYFALLAAITTLGLFSGGIYFLLKIFRKGHQRKYRQLRKSQKQDEWRKFFKVWLFTSLIVLLGLIGIPFLL